jgi:hypothetical protein
LVYQHFIILFGLSKVDPTQVKCCHNDITQVGFSLSCPASKYDQFEAPSD